VRVSTTANMVAPRVHGAGGPPPKGATFTPAGVLRRCGITFGTSNLRTDTSWPASYNACAASLARRAFKRREREVLPRRSLSSGIGSVSLAEPSHPLGRREVGLRRELRETLGNGRTLHAASTMVLLNRACPSCRPAKGAVRQLG